jgi:hypothetical protein
MWNQTCASEEKRQKIIVNHTFLPEMQLQENTFKQRNYTQSRKNNSTYP